MLLNDLHTRRPEHGYFLTITDILSFFFHSFFPCFFSFLYSSLLVTVLEAFHFDHHTLSREMEAAKARECECLYLFLLICSFASLFSLILLLILRKVSSFFYVWAA